MANRIFARSPFIIRVNEAGQLGSKIEIFIWNAGGSPPSPNYTYKFSKLAPSPTNTANYYNISPYIQEYINHNQNQTPYNSSPSTPNSQWCSVYVIRYKLSAGGYSVLDSTQYKAYNGYGYYEDGTNPQLTNYFLEQGTYYYNYDVNADFATQPLTRCGHITAEKVIGSYFRYTNLVTGAVNSSSMTAGEVMDTPRVYFYNYMDGNKVELFNASNVLQATWYFRPIVECRYTPVVIDFVNRYGAWQREFFFKASTENMNVKTNSYNLMQSNLYNYSVTEGQSREFNVNGNESIKVNSGLRNEDFFSSIKQLMLSERILLNNEPVKLKTKNIEKFKEVNTKIINYTLEFEYAFDTINNVM
jgi:hypothetical protein